MHDKSVRDKKNLLGSVRWTGFCAVDNVSAAHTVTAECVGFRRKFT